MSDVVIGNTQPDKVALAADLKTFVELFNSLNTRLNGELFDSSSPVSNRFIQGNFTFENTDQRGCNGKIAFNIDALRRWFNNAV